MTADYKSAINMQIKDAVNQWIEDLKTKHPELLLTRQWQALYPKGFRPGNNVIPLVTGSKQGRHLIAEINLVLPDNLELDLNSVELTLKNETYIPDKTTQKVKPSLDQPIDVLNDIIVSVNAFLSGIDLPSGTVAYTPQPVKPSEPRTVNVKTDMPLSADRDELKQRMIRSTDLPDWFRTIESAEVKSGLLDKLADSFLHYQRQNNRTITLGEFFEIFSEHLKKQGKLHHYCRYKAKPVTLDRDNHCTESYCSRKPYNNPCAYTVLKFGAF